MTQDNLLADLYREHLDALLARTSRILAESGFDHLLVAAGVEKFQFLDDRPYPFAPNPHFKAWLPLLQHPHSWIALTPGEQPHLICYQPDDYWHLPPSAPEGFWTAYFRISTIGQPEEAVRRLPAKGRLAIIGESDAALPGFLPNNPPDVLAALHYQRAFKSAYEVACMRAASRRAVAGHRAAEQAFRAGGSELEIHRAYLVASGHGDLDLPYGNIVALNEHAAVLHYQHQRPDPPTESRSFLIDAGASHAGYAADITRTHAAGPGVFEDLIEAVDAVEQALVEQVRDGNDYRRIHLDAHHRLAGVLAETGIVRMSPESQVETGLSSTFFPHGVGHLIGLQVHDVAGLQSDESGGQRDRPAGHPFLRLTRDLAPGMAVTIEPGIYFIPTLLDRLRAGPHAGVVDWSAVEQLLPFGGVRIEDDVVCTAGAPLNLTREAFAA